MSEKVGSGTYIIDDEYNILDYNHVAGTLYPQLVKGKKCYACLMKRDTPCLNCPVYNKILGPNTYIDPIRNILETVDCVEIPLENGKLGHALVFSTTENSGKNSLVNGYGDLRLLGYINALALNYTIVFSVDVHSHYSQILRSPKDVLAIHEANEQDNSYEKLIDAYVRNNVLEEDRERVLHSLNFDNCVRTLSSTVSFKTHYRVYRNKEIHYYYCKCVRAGEEGSLDSFILAIANEDQDVQSNTMDFSLQKKRKILIVEDNSLNREMLVEILQDQYECIEVENGKQALTYLQDNYKNISIVLLDVQMPVMDGFEVLRHIQKDPLLSSIPVIVTTGSDSMEDELKCLDLGASDYITKPYNSRALKARIQNVIKLKETATTISAIETDSLTGVYTEQAFYHHAKQYLSLHPEIDMHMISVNIKSLKLINSIYGERKGDDLIIYLSKALQKELPSKALMCRSSGNRFLILTDDSQHYTKKEIEAFCQRISDNSPIPNVVFKFGIYPHINKNLPLRNICDCANTAVQSIEGDFSKSVAFYDDALSKRFLMHQQMEGDFQDALDHGEFTVYLQPKVDARTEKVIGAEALVRWKKGDTLIPPGEFIPLFESDGLIVKLDHFMFQEVCRIQKKRLVEGKLVVPISVNLSRASLHHKGVVQNYMDIIHQYDVPQRLVPIELTESATYYGTPFAKAAQKLADASFELELDDFGSGYSSLTSINSLPFSVMKLDKSLIDYITVDKGRILVYYMTVLAHGLGMNVLAEGVETAEQVQLLRNMDCDEIQGYYYSKPVPYDEFTTDLKKTSKD